MASCWPQASLGAGPTPSSSMYSLSTSPSKLGLAQEQEVVQEHLSLASCSFSLAAVAATILDNLSLQDMMVSRSQGHIRQVDIQEA